MDFHQDHDHFGLGYKVQTLDIKRGITWCRLFFFLFVLLLLFFFYTSFKPWACNTEEIPSDTPVELCCYYYLKINTPRKCSATDSLAFYTGNKNNNLSGFLCEYIFTFSLANINKLTCYKQMYLYFEGRQFLCLERKYIYRYPPVEESFGARINSKLKQVVSFPQSRPTFFVTFILVGNNHNLFTFIIFQGKLHSNNRIVARTGIFLHKMLKFK